jgi:hypothetical protein
LLSGFSIASGAFFLYTLFHQTGDNDIQSCINGSTDDLKKEACKKGFEVIRGVIVGVFVLVWLIELCAYSNFQLLRQSHAYKLNHIDGCIIVSNYVEQLDEEEAAQYPDATVGLGALGTTYNKDFVPNYAFASPYGGRGNSSSV